MFHRHVMPWKTLPDILVSALCLCATAGICPSRCRRPDAGIFSRLLEKNWIGSADREKGRFRSFLLTAMKWFLADEWDKARAQKRGGGRIVSLQFDAADTRCAREPVDTLTPEQSFEWRWALTLLERVMSRLQAEFARDGKAELLRL